ncbi:uncharacterized protein LOC135193780 [Vanessa tameamea]|uniref:Uncharacterized protein LOC135193780 n=1 Tax=Vanessa tameamea TaxID=334116 RepID=A0ABM4AR81_VANTA
MNHDYKNELKYNLYNDIQTLPNDVETRLTSTEKVYKDKTTYCRPVLSYYNEQFIYKTMERNARLKRLVKNLAVARQREKETVSWNNFINELKNKHALKSDETKLRLVVKESEEYITPEIFNDYYKTKFSRVQSRPCKHFLHEFYGTYDESESNCTYCRQLNERQLRQSQANKYSPRDRDSYCYPTSSRGRLILMDKERRKKQSINNWPSHLHDKYLSQRSRVVNSRLEKAVDTEMYKDIPNYNRIFCHSRATSFDKMISVEADIKFYPDFVKSKYNDKATYKTDPMPSALEDNIDTDINDEILPGHSNNLKKLSLINIDNKLENLIKSINKFIDEINKNKQKRKRNEDYKNIQYKYAQPTNDEGEINLTEKDSIPKHVSKDTNKCIICKTAGISEHQLNWSLKNYRQSYKVNKIIQEGAATSKSIKNTKSIQFSSILKSKSSSVQFTFEIPTKDCSTEVTKSLSKHKTCSENGDAIIEEICGPEHDFPHQRMTIAVNTDPLSFLSLLRISTDTFKSFLSYVPNVDCYSYLSLLQFPQSTRNIESHYVCNICGADFNKPSKLSDHIRGHDLGQTKDCCVCRHVLDKVKKTPGLFRCRYCGQPFVRAYCCELHQQTCARRFGLHHDVTSSLMLLR